jgi:hypothetical protein
MTEAVFHKWRNDGDIVALFPEERYGRHDYAITSCMHVGHSAANYEYRVRLIEL